MRIVYFRLKGYAGIYHGMGLNEIVIPFDRINSKIILIRGENGCGKSTILKALSLDIDSTDNYRTDKVYNRDTDSVDTVEYPAEKEIHLIDGNDLYRILIQSNVINNSRKPTKAYISLNGEELNPNGNVSSYKDIRNSILDIDPNYITLSMVSSENRGLVDRSPSERKKFMSSIVDSLEFYNECYKLLGKKSSIYKSNINSIKSKIYNLGDIDQLYERFKFVENQLLNIKNEKESINNKIIESNLKIQMIDKNGKIQDSYNNIIESIKDIKDRRNTLESNYKNIINSYKNKYNQIFDNNIIDKIKEKINILSGEKSSIETEILILNKELVLLNNTIDKNLFKISNLQQDISDDIVSVYNNTLNDLKSYEKILIDNNIDYNNFIDISDISILFNISKDILSNINSIYDNDDNLISIVCDYISDNINIINEKNNIENNIKEIDINIQHLEINKDKLLLDIEKSKIVNDRPKQCKIDTCPFIKDSLIISKKLPSINESLDNINNNISELIDKKNSLISKSYEYDSIKDIYLNIMNLLDIFKCNNKIISNILDINKKQILDRLKSHNMFFEFSNTNISKYKMYLDIIEKIKTIKSNLSEIKSNMSIYKNSKSIIDDLNNDINEMKNKSDNITKTINEKMDKLKKIDIVLSNTKEQLDDIDNILKYDDMIKKISIEYNDLEQEYLSIKESISKIKDYVNDVNEYSSYLSNIEKEYTDISNMYDELKFNIERYKSYKLELSSIENISDKVEFIKKACSPTSTGIQSIFISIYMSKTITIANDLLRYLFNGELQLLEPIIDPNNFTIPFTNRSGVSIDDISIGSTSQKCMIGMVLGFSLMSQGSSKYNIIRLDEIDGGLDTNNRVQFINMLLTLMDIMSVEQCITCSHNIESDIYNSYVINVTKNGINISN